MASHTVETAPQLYARIAGVLYVIIIILAVFAPFAVAPSGLTRADVATTAAEILASKSRYSLGGAAELIVNACDIGVALIFYELLTPVSRSLAPLVVFFRLAFVAIASVNVLNHLAFIRRTSPAPGILRSRTAFAIRHHSAQSSFRKCG